MERPGREQQGARVAIVAHGCQVRGNRLVGQVAGGDDVGQGRAAKAAGAPAVGQVGFDKAAVPAPQAAKGIQRLDRPRAFRPAAAHSAGERDHRHHPRLQGIFADLLESGFHPAGRVEQIVGVDVGNAAGGGKAILRQTDAPVAQVRLNLLVLHAVKSVSIQQRFQALRGIGFLRALRNEMLKDALHHPLKFRDSVAGGGEALEFQAAQGREQAGFHAQKSGHHHLVIAGGHQRLFAFAQHGARAALVDGKIVDDGLHGEGRGVFHGPPGVAHDGLQALLPAGFGRPEQR